MMTQTEKTPTKATKQLILLFQISQQPKFALPDGDEEAPEPDEIDKFPEEGDEIENLPPMQPDVDPLERENPEEDDLEDNEPLDDTDEATTEKENLLEKQPTPTGQTIVVERRIGKDGL